jgi:hypothetical protein
MAKGRIKSYLRFLRELPGFLRSPIDVHQAKDKIAHRMASREEKFLNFVKRCVYNNPVSPYLKLFNEVGCEYGDLSAGVRKDGLEAMLRHLLSAGVWLSLDEFKGRIPIRRGSIELNPESADFENPYLPSGVEVKTGGSSGRSSRTKMDLGFMTERACYDSLMIDMLGLWGTSLALWYPILPAATGVGNSLRYAKAGYIPKRWFSMTQHLANPESRLATSSIIWISHLAGFPLPKPEPIAMHQLERIVEWVVDQIDREGQCVFQSYVSQAVRICAAGRKRRSDMKGLTVIVGSEPLTYSKYNEIISSGAKVYPRYAATELGTIAMGCGNPINIDEVHLASDMIALVQDGNTSDQAAPLFYTALNSIMPNVMINVQLGDMGVVHKRGCGCLFEKMGFHTHLSNIRSCERSTGEGMAVNSRILEHILEDIILPRYGGSALDYQWVEMEDENGLTQLPLRISPDIGPVNDENIIRDILDGLGRAGEGEKIMADIWRQAGTLSVVRETPQCTRQGKILIIQRSMNVHRT